MFILHRIRFHEKHPVEYLFLRVAWHADQVHQSWDFNIVLSQIPTLDVKQVAFFNMLEAY